MALEFMERFIQNTQSFAMPHMHTVILINSKSGHVEQRVNTVAKWYRSTRGVETRRVIIFDLLLLGEWLMYDVFYLENTRLYLWEVAISCYVFHFKMRYVLNQSLKSHISLYNSCSLFQFSRWKKSLWLNVMVTKSGF